MGRHAQRSVRLETGERVGYSLSQRRGDPYWFVRFRDRDGRYPEKSTGKASEQAAITAAENLIVEAYRRAPLPSCVSWDEVEADLG